MTLGSKTGNKVRSYTMRACFAGALCLIVAVFMAMFFGSGIAQGAATADSSTIGLGESRSVTNSDDQENGADRLQSESAQSDNDGVSDAYSVDGTKVKASSGESLKKATTRSISVKDPDPVIELAAVDYGDARTVQIAGSIGTTEPLETAPRIQPDTSGDEWMVGQASGYDIASSSTITRSGRAFDDQCVTVAVPEGKESLLGSAVEIVYNGKVVIATVTDTGGFEKYGRALDLGGGVFKAFGAQTTADWGVRTVHYRYL